MLTWTESIFILIVFGLCFLGGVSLGYEAGAKKTK